MSDHEWERVGMGRFDVDKMDAEAIDLSLELRKAVESGFARAPIVFFEPVLADLQRIGERQALRPIIDTFALGPSRGAQASLQVIQLFIGSGNLELGDFSTHRDSSSVRLLPIDSIFVSGRIFDECDHDR